MRILIHSVVLFGSLLLTTWGIHPLPPTTTHAPLEKIQTVSSSMARQIQKDIQRAYAPKSHVLGWQFQNLAQGFDAAFSDQGISVTSNVKDNDVKLDMSLRRAGWKEELKHMSATVPVVRDHRIEYQRRGLTEWYVNEPHRLEQGFTFHEAPQGTGDHLALEFQLQQGQRVEVLNQGAEIVLSSQDGKLRCRNLVAFDATGVTLPLYFESTENDSWQIVVNAKSAVFPVVVDPDFMSYHSVVMGDENSSLMGNAMDSQDDRVVVTCFANRSVYVFDYEDDTTWTLAERITPDTTSSINFGSHVAIDDDVIAVAAQPDVFLFKYNDVDEVFEEHQVISSTADGFGNCVALDAGRLVIGASRALVLGSINGLAFVYEYDDVDDEYVIEATLAPATADYRFFGHYVAIQGERIFVAAPTSGDGGEVFVYNYDDVDEEWVEDQILAPAEAERFGMALDVDGDWLIVTEPVDSYPFGNEGSTYIYQFDDLDEEWVQVGKMIPDDLDDDAFYGGDPGPFLLTRQCVSLKDNIFVVSAFEDEDLSGSAYVYMYNPDDDIWEQQGEKLLYPAADTDTMGTIDSFGSSVTMCRNKVLVGCLGVDAEDPDSDASGGFYTFQIEWDMNGDGYLDVADPIYLLEYLLNDGDEPVIDYGYYDVDGSGLVTMADAAELFHLLFTSN